MKRVIIGLLIVGAVGAGAGAIYVRRGGPEVQVQTSPVTRGDIVDTVGATGTLQAVARRRLQLDRQERPGDCAARPVAVRGTTSAGARQLESDARQPRQGTERSRADQGAARRRPAEVHAVERTGREKPVAAERPRRGQDRGRFGAGEPGVAAGDGRADAGRRLAVAGVGQPEPGQPRPHHHQRAD